VINDNNDENFVDYHFYARKRERGCVQKGDGDVDGDVVHRATRSLVYLESEQVQGMEALDLHSHRSALGHRWELPLHIFHLHRQTMETI
jgi:hypothetical protein